MVVIAVYLLIGFVFLAGYFLSERDDGRPVTLGYLVMLAGLLFLWPWVVVASVVGVIFQGRRYE